jgi:hypothetical protein
MKANVFEAIRTASALVMERARYVSIDAARLGALADELLRMPPAPPEFDPGHHRVGGPKTTLAFIVTLNCINFGSGYFPFLAKRPGLSGYLTIATSLKEHYSAHAAWSPRELVALDASKCAAVFAQSLAIPEVGELMELFARALNDLGRFIEERHGGRFAGLVEAADGSAARLVADLATIPFYRDVARYGDLEVPFYKRAQITAADLAVAFEGQGYGAFRDIEDLTIFADNLVPHVLRQKGVLVYAEELCRRIDRGELIPSGSIEEIEIRAGAVHAVERCIAQLRARGSDITARKVDYLLWTSGHSPDMKAHPRHRTRTTFY